MSRILEGAVEALNAKLDGAGLGGSVAFVIEDEGTLLLDGEGARIGEGAGEGEADCTLTADADTFRAILDGELGPTAAFMGGRLKVDGDMGLAMRLASLLA